MRNDQHGFTLLELMVVVIVMALIAAGLTVGRSMERNGEIRTISEDFQKYTNAVRMFKDKYGELPGDMYRATDIWAGTGNGNGDGRIGSWDDDVPTIAQESEMFRVWQHLALGTFIEGSYSGVTGGTGTRDGVVGVNVPKSTVSNAGWSMHYYKNISNASAYNFRGIDSHILVLGRQNVGNLPNLPILTPQEQLTLDAKIDDGRPGTGVLRAPADVGAYPDCVSSIVAASATYDTGDGALTCLPVFAITF